MARIFLIDDDDSFRRMLRTTLVTMGHEVIFDTHRAEGAMNQLSAVQPEVLIADIIMPGMEGLELISEFRRRYPTVRIIAMSGAGRIVKTNYFKMALAKGANAVLAKPFSNEELEAAIAPLQVAGSDTPGQSKSA